MTKKARLANIILRPQKTYCLGCNQHVHLISECTALSNVAINVIKKLVNNCMLMCNTCLENGERGVFIGLRALTKIERKILDLKIDEVLLQFGKKITDLFDSKLQI